MRMKKYQEDLLEKYNTDNLFINKNNLTQDNISTETAVVEYKEKNFIQKLFDKIKYLFRKNKEKRGKDEFILFQF